MHRVYHRWYSPALDRDMEMLVFGHTGAPVLVFPTSHGRFHEFEDRGMVAALAHQVEHGDIQLICVDSVNEESWYNFGAHPDLRMYREDQYQHYVLTEVLPLIRSENDNPFLMATGCSFGATAAAIFTFRNPGLIKRFIGLHGLYDLRSFFPSYTEAVYFHNPVDFMANLDHEWSLAQLRTCDIIIASSSFDENVESNHRFSQILWEKGIWHATRIWDGWHHDWPFWKEWINRYISGHD
jgi:esterase/lipase superfamily enzyme